MWDRGVKRSAMAAEMSGCGVGGGCAGGGAGLSGWWAVFAKRAARWLGAVEVEAGALGRRSWGWEWRGRVGAGLMIGVAGAGVLVGGFVEDRKEEEEEEEEEEAVVG